MSDITLNKIHLQKDIYEAKQARDVLDEEIVEFLPSRRSIKEFFDIYNKKFFSILTSTHNFFIKNSLEYIKSWTNPKQTLIKNLELEIENLQFEINNTEKYHPLFPNRIVICPQPSSQYDTLNDCDLFYMHSGKARKIQGENKENIFNTIKARHRSQNTLNTKFIIEVSQSMLDGMEMGKPIESEEDLNDSFYTLNTYNG